MMTTVDALKALYVLLGGSADDVENITLIPDMINAYENLPSLTAVEIDSGERTVIDNSAGVLIQTGSSGGSISLTNSNDIDIKTMNGGMISLDSDGDISLDSNSEITVQAVSAIGITCSGGVTISAPTDTASTGGTNVTLAADADIDLNADEEINLYTNGNIYVKIGSGSKMTLENYIKQVAGIS